MQLPKYEDEKLLNKIQTQLANSPELIDYESIVELKKHLAALNQNESFLIIGGPCAEDIVFNSDYIKKTIETIITLSKNISQQTQHEVIYGGRIGGQFAKPRTEQYETIGNQTLPVYKGDMINHIDFTVTARTPKPELMIDGYTTSSKTIKLGKKLDPKFYFTHEALLIHYEEPQIKTKGSEHYLSSTHIP
jgi:3-deoxy-7-phosphoheptulonate synthase